MSHALPTPGPAPHVLVVGEALVDVVVPVAGAVAEHPGGSPANVALTLGRLGRQVELLAWLAADDRGQAVADWLAQSHVAVHPLSYGAERTSSAVARLDPQGAATYEFDLEWHLPPVAALAADLAGAQVVHTGSIGALLGSGGEAIPELLRRARASALVTYDPNVRPAILPDRASVRSQVAERVGLADVVKASDEDLAWLYPDEPVEAVAARWASAGPGLVVVTRGGEGALAVTSDGVTVEVPARRVTVVDTVGAGDSFMGAFLDGLIARGLVGAGARSQVGELPAEEVSALVGRCVAVAAVTVSRAGANPPWAAELA